MDVVPCLDAVGGAENTSALPVCLQLAEVSLDPIFHSARWLEGNRTWAVQKAEYVVRKHAHQLPGRNQRPKTLVPVISPTLVAVHQQCQQHIVCR